MVKALVKRFLAFYLYENFNCILNTFANISNFLRKGAFFILLQCIALPLLSQSWVNNRITMEKYVVDHKEVNKYRFINDSILYTEGWHTLPQTKFWQQVMLLSPDSAIVNLASNRKVLDKISVKDWNKWSENQQLCYKDSIRRYHQLADSAMIYVTAGKRDFYEYKKVIPTISKSISVFEQYGVDPWYAQAILLIESPGKISTKSNVGANGPFQLMKSVAIQQGLTVNKYVDERTDIERAAYGASRLLSRICIPRVKTMLDSAHLTYNETDLWFRLLVLHAYHAGSGNIGGVIKKINPCEGGMDLMQTVWRTTYGGFKNASQNYSQLALAAFCNFDKLVMQPTDSVFLSDGDRMMKCYSTCAYAPYDRCTYLSNCITSYENDLLDGVIPFDYFISKVNTVESALASITPMQYPYACVDERYSEIGFKLLKVRNFEAAYKAFKLSETSAPESFDVYHGLGETYRLMGQKDMALLNYRKSLLLNPNHEASLKALSRLSSK